MQVYYLYKTWTDSYGAISFTFGEDGKLHVSGLEDTLSVDAFAFSEIDDDTLQLKGESDNPIIGVVGLNMDYEIEGDTMTVSIAGMELKPFVALFGGKICIVKIVGTNFRKTLNFAENAE